MKKHIKNYCFRYLLFFLIFNTIGAQTNKFLFERITVTEGLSQNNASDVIQDDFGFIWVGTEDAINRYDGYEIKIFKTNPGDTNSIAPGRISKLFCDSEGNLWIGAGLNISRFNYDTQKFTNFAIQNIVPDSINRNDIIALQEDKQKNIWFASHAGILGYYSSTGDSLVYLNNLLMGENENRFGRINFMQFIKGDRLWIGFAKGLAVFDLIYSGNEVQKLIEIKLLQENIQNPSAVYEDINGKIWIGTWGKGFYSYDLNTGKIDNIELNNSPFQFKDLGISSIISNSLGELFIGTGSINDFGLLKYKPGDNSIINITHDPKDENSLSGNRIACLLIDRSGMLWVGTWNRGLNKLNEASTKFNLIRPLSDDQSSLNSGFIRGFLEDYNNIMWILTSGGGLHRYDPQSGTFNYFVNDRNNPGTISSDVTNSIFEENDNTLWIGTTRGLNKFDKKNKKFTRFYFDKKNPNAPVNQLMYGMTQLPGFQNVLWIGTRNGMVKFNTKTSEMQQILFENSNATSDDDLNQIIKLYYFPTYPSKLWIASFGGLIIYDIYSGESKIYQHERNNPNSLSASWTLCVQQDQDGHLWVGTYGGGLNKFDYESENFTRFTEENSSIPNNVVYGILTDDNRNLWFSTNKGLCRFNIDTYQSRTYTFEDGLQSNEFNGGAFYKSPDGEMFFGGLNGYNSFYPDNIRENPNPPEIALVDFRVFNESLASGKDSPLNKNIMTAHKVILNHWQNDISIDYVGLHYYRSSKNLYSFFLENYDSEWRDVKFQKTATYTNLDPGEYIFHVRAANSDGVWNETGKKLNITILPPWWKTIPAYIFYAFLLGTGIFGVDRIQRRRILTKERTAAALNEAELRAQIAESENARKTKELDEARALQLSMLPKELPKLPNLDIAVYMRTATEVGGDYYDFHVHPDGTLTVLLGDATGHGMQAGMMVSIMKSLFMSDRLSKDIKPFFNNSSEAIKDMQLGRLLMALTCVQFNADKIRVANAGMPPIYIYKHSSKRVEEISINNMPLGAMKTFDYEVQEFPVEPNDVILLMSDGFAELKNGNDDMFSYRRARNSFEEIAEKEPEEIITYMKGEGLRWTNDVDPDDDITFVVIKVK